MAASISTSVRRAQLCWHTCLFIRFWHKVLFDLAVMSVTAEPFQKL